MAIISYVCDMLVPTEDGPGYGPGAHLNYPILPGHPHKKNHFVAIRVDVDGKRFEFPLTKKYFRIVLARSLAEMDESDTLPMP